MREGLGGTVTKPLSQQRGAVYPVFFFFSLVLFLLMSYPIVSTSLVS